MTKKLIESQIQIDWIKVVEIFNNQYGKSPNFARSNGYGSLSIIYRGSLQNLRMNLKLYERFLHVFSKADRRVL